MRLTWIVMLLALILQAQSLPAQQNKVLRGRVVDSRTGEPIAKALVSIRDLKIETTTDENGNFEIRDLKPGEIELYVTTVGYDLIRKTIAISSTESTVLQIVLGPEIRRADEVTVTAPAFVTPEPTTISDHTLTQAEIRSLSSVLIDDPLRAVQSLPGVSTGDDFNAQFATRGAGFDSIGFNMDGVLLESPFHEVSDIDNGGSLSILNPDVIDSLSLLSGSFPAKFGDRTAAELDVTTRDGNTKRWTNSIAVGAAGIGWTSEGPIGKSNKVSWLGSVRKSYLNYLIGHLSSDPNAAAFIFGFYDGFGKVTYKPTSQQEIRLSGNFGNSKADQSQLLNTLGVNSFLYAEEKTRIGNLDWRWIPSSKFVADTSVSYMNSYGNNVNRNEELLYDSNFEQETIRQDFTIDAGVGNRIEGGYSARRLSQYLQIRLYNFSTAQFDATDNVDRAAWQPGGYIQDTLSTRGSRAALTYGLRFDRSDITGQNIWMPRAAATFGLTPSTRLSLGFGQYSQFPDFQQLFGEFGNGILRAQRATHYNLEVDQSLGDKTRFRAEVYDREDRDGIYSIDSEFRLSSSGKTIQPLPSAQLQNNLRGYSRGVEVFLQRRSTNKLSGWISYDYGIARSRDADSQIVFNDDFDQRHTANVFGSYRWTNSLNLSLKYRYGSNFPLPGFFKMQNGQIVLADVRNQLRMPMYSRLDLRVDKAFRFNRWQLTLYGEVINVLGRQNLRYVSDADTVNSRVSVEQNPLFPLVPIAGIRIDF